MDNNQKNLEAMSELESNLFNKYSQGGTIPFQIIGGSIFRVGSGTILDMSTFRNQQFDYIQGQVNDKSGSAYEQIKKESDYLIQIIDHFVLCN